MKNLKGFSMSLLTMIVIFVAVLAISIILFNPGGVIESFNELLGKLEGGFDKEHIKLSGGNKALHVYLRNVAISANPEYGIHILEFHLLNYTKHVAIKEHPKATFIIREWKKDKCTIFVSDDSIHTGPGKDVRGNRIYYVNTGTIIQDGLKNLNEAVANSENGCVCIGSVDKMGEFTIQFSTGCSGTVVCNGVKLTLDVNFGKTGFDKCDKYKDCKECCPGGECCHLLQKNELGLHVYRIKYGIICGNSEGNDEAYWWACTKDNSDMKINALGKTYVCKFEDGIGKWIES